MSSNLRASVPWWFRIGVKLALARLPIPYDFWKKVRLFEHGDMNEPQSAWNNFFEHAATADVLDTQSDLLQLKVNDGEFSVLELGPGDSLFSAVISMSLGASRSWLVDAGNYALSDMAAYVGLIDFLQNKGFVFPFDTAPMELADVLNECNSQYLTDGVRSLTRLPAASVDFCFSNAVLEHIPKGDFSKLADELVRVLKPNGVCVHRVDLRDHLGGGLNNLRFSEATWESALFRNSGFYTNRIRYSQIVKIFESAGFECTLPRVIRWDSIPLTRSKLDTSFHPFQEDDLLVSGFDIVLRHESVCT